MSSMSTAIAATPCRPQRATHTYDCPLMTRGGVCTCNPPGAAAAGLAEVGTGRRTVGSTVTGGVAGLLGEGFYEEADDR